MEDSSTVLYGLASIPSLCYVHLGCFELEGVDRHCIVVCTRIPPRGSAKKEAPSITAYGLCSLLYHSPDNNERVSLSEALSAIKDGRRISKKRSWGIGQELDLLLTTATATYERLRDMRLMELRRIQGARTIQRAWIPIVNDPRRASVRERLLVEFDLLVEETAAFLRLENEI